jgi:hypothetical protein
MHHDTLKELSTASFLLPSTVHADFLKVGHVSDLSQAKGGVVAAPVTTSVLE